LRLLCTRFAILLLLSCCLVPAPLAFSAQAPRVETLENGLKVVLLEDHASPLVATAVWVHVGGKDESEQVAGFAHYLEHLIPQGTKNRAPHQQQLEVFQSGGIASVQADYDRTFFFFLVPKEAQDRALEGLLQLVSQADLSEAAVEKTRPAITRELKEVYDDPSQVLFLEQMRAAFPGQPYRFPFYGSFQSLTLLERTTAEAFYRNFYVANNMVVAVGGDINPALTLDKIRKLFGVLKPSKALPPKAKFEPGFKGSRQVVKNLGSLSPSVSLLFPTPGYRHPDRFALTALARLLEGSAATQILKPAGDAHTLAFSASSGFHLLEERGLLAFTCYPVSSQAIPGTVRAMTELLAKISSDGFSEAEVRRVVQGMRLEAAVRRSTVGSLTQEVAEGVLFGDARYGWNVESSLEKITSEEIRRVASTYLVGDDATNLIILPKEEKKPEAEVLEKIAETVASLGPGKGKSVSPDFAAVTYSGDKPPLAARAEPRPSPAASRSTLPNGLTVILKPAPGQGIVAVSLQIRAGFAFDPAGKEGTAQMVAASLPLGSETVTAGEFRERAAALGSSFGVSLAVETVETGLTVFPGDLKSALELIASAVRAPAIAEADLPGMRDRLARYRDAQSHSPRDTAEVLAREKIFRSHPYSRASMGGDAILASISREDLLSFHRSYYRPSRAVLTVVGDFRRDGAMEVVEAAFGPWKASAGGKPPVELEDLGAPDPLSGEYSRVIEATPSELVLAYPGLPLKDPQFPMLRALATIISARGFVDLVLEQPVAFSVTSNLEGWSRGGMVALQASASRIATSKVAYELMLRGRALGLKPVASETIRDVKAVERGRLLREKEMLYSQASNLGYYELLGPGFGMYDEGKTLPADLSSTAIQEAAARFLDTSRLVRVTAGYSPR